MEPKAHSIRSGEAAGVLQVFMVDHTVFCVQGLYMKTNAFLTFLE
jgi:hypothetical protein